MEIGWRTKVREAASLKVGAKQRSPSDNRGQSSPDYYSNPANLGVDILNPGFEKGLVLIAWFTKPT